MREFIKQTTTTRPTKKGVPIRDFVLAGGSVLFGYCIGLAPVQECGACDKFRFTGDCDAARYGVPIEGSLIARLFLDVAVLVHFGRMNEEILTFCWDNSQLLSHDFAEMFFFSYCFHTFAQISFLSYVKDISA